MVCMCSIVLATQQRLANDQERASNYDQETKLHHSKATADHLFAVWLMHKIIEHAVLIFMLTASVF